MNRSHKITTVLALADNSISYFVVALSLYFCASLSLAETQEVWIDVRSAFEHKLYSLDGDVRIDHEKLAPKLNLMCQM